MTPPASGTAEKHTWSAATWLQLIAIVVFWSANWPLTKSILAYASPLAFTAMRFVCAVLAMFVISLVTRQPLLPVAGERVPLALIGLLQVGGMLAFGFAGLQFLGPGRAAVLVYTMPIWSIPLGWLLTREPVTFSGLIGAGAGLAGIVLFLNPALVNWADRNMLIGNGLGLAAAICWALGACLYRRRRWETGFWTQTFWQVLWSAAVLTVPLWMAGAQRPVVLNAGLLAVLAYNALAATALCYWVWGKVLATTSASRAGQFLTLVPVCAMLMSKAYTGEVIGVTAAASVLLICGGVLIAMRGKARARPVASL